MDKKETLYIPMGIKEKNEFWEGFGSEELKGSLAYMFILSILNMLVNVLFGNILFFITITIIIIATALVVYTKGSTNLSVVDQIVNMREFSSSQKKYYYRSLNEWR